MKTNEQTEENKIIKLSFGKACLAGCQRLIASIDQARIAVLDEFREVREANEQLLRLALNEAEALAWQTEYPQLFFPTLATEKAHSVAAWAARQQSILGTPTRLALAA